MKANRFLILLSFSIFCAANATTKTTFGDMDCGRWFKSQTEDLWTAWLAGYLSGLSTFYSGQSDPAKQIKDWSQAKLWMDKFCRENPLSDIEKGGLQLFRELESQGKK